MKDKATLTLFKGLVFATAVLFLLAFSRTGPCLSPGRPATGEPVAHSGSTGGASLAVVVSPTVLATRPPATLTPTPLPITPTSTPTAVPLPVAGLGHALARGSGSLFDVVQEREQSGRVAGFPPTPTPVPLPTSQPPVRIVAPSIGLDAPVAPMYWKKVTRGSKVTMQWSVPRNEAGWHFNSALPGEPGNTVLSGHRNIYSEVFRDLEELQPGDEIQLVAGAQRWVYYVDEIHILQELGVSDSVRAQNAQWISPTSDVRLTLVTCWPYKAPGNTHRLIVVARP